MKKVLITGASGLIGTRLKEVLLSKGIGVHTLGRSNSTDRHSAAVAFQWDIRTGKLDDRAFDGVSTIIHLAGASIAEKRWTASRKKEIIESRVKSAGMIYDFLKKGEHHVATFISASAVGYYGDCGAEVVTEEHAPGNDFLSDVCKKWEASAMQIGSLGLREVRLRNGIVLSPNGGALPELMKGIKMGLAGYFNKPHLYYPWIHLDDVAGILIHAINQKDMHGAYNTTAPHPVLMKGLIQEILRIKKSNALMVPAPAFLVELALGELSSMLLCSQRCSAEKILSAGYHFRYPEISKALKAVLG